jgi:hypothetical protein
MKKIQPLNGFWLNGQFVSAVFLKLYLGIDDLESEAKFYYEFLSEDKTMLAKGNLTMTGDTYQNWDGSNIGAWHFAVTQLGVILVETK